MELHDRRIDNESLSAFTVAELGEMWPQERIKRVSYWLNEARMSHGWAIGYVSHNKGLLDNHQILHPSEAYAMMLVYLLENKLVTL